jgi:nucleotide-binding universal stress UspA family protein
MTAAQLDMTTGLFERVICGVDHSDAGVAAARIAGLVAAPAGSLTLVTANDRSIAVHAGWSMAHVLEQLAAEARSALDRGRTEAERLHSVATMLVEGEPRAVLMAEIEREDATTVVVGSHGRSRTSGIALGSVSTHLLHEAPCAVLIARGEVDPETWPARIVVGVDDSADSARAYEAAVVLGERFGAEVHALAADVGTHVDLGAVLRIAPDCEVSEADALDALVAASETADLVAVGSRRLHGLRALGSVSERLAHQARCSVLVARPDASLSAD